MTTLAAFLSDVQTRKKALGLTDTPAQTESLRNKGAKRTAAKRAMLRRAGERAHAAGQQPVAAYF